MKAGGGGTILVGESTLNLTRAIPIQNSHLYSGRIMTPGRNQIKVTYHPFTNDDPNMMDWYMVGLEHSHPNLVRVYGKAFFLPKKDKSVIVTEEVTETLGSWVKEKGLGSHENMDSLKEFLRETLNVMRFFRDKLGRQHRGISEENIFIQNGVAKLANSKDSSSGFLDDVDVRDFCDMVDRIFTLNNVIMPPDLKRLCISLRLYCMNANTEYKKQKKESYLKDVYDHPALLSVHKRNRYIYIAKSRVFGDTLTENKVNKTLYGLLRARNCLVNWMDGIGPGKYRDVLVFNAQEPNKPTYGFKVIEFLRYSFNCCKHVKGNPHDIDTQLGNIYPQYLEHLHDALCFSDMTFSI